jgi:hypothetical protein
MINFAAIADKTIGDPAVTLTATATSGLEVTLTANTDHITINGNTATLVKAGKARITATQAGNDLFNAATPVEREFCVKPAKPAVTVSGVNTESPTLTSSASTGNQWFKDGVSVDGQTNSTLQVTAAGVYTVQVTVETCSSAMSNDVPIVVTGDIGYDRQVVIAPNPVEDELMIQLPDTGTRQISIYTPTGVVMHAFPSQKNEEYVNVKHYAGGLYIVRIIGANGSYMGRFIKK